MNGGRLGETGTADGVREWQCGDEVSRAGRLHVLETPRETGDTRGDGTEDVVASATRRGGAGAHGLGRRRRFANRGAARRATDRSATFRADRGSRSGGRATTAGSGLVDGHGIRMVVVVVVVAVATVLGRVFDLRRVLGSALVTRALGRRRHRLWLSCTLRRRSHRAADVVYWRVVR